MPAAKTLTDQPCRAEFTYIRLHEEIVFLVVILDASRAGSSREGTGMITENPFNLRPQLLLDATFAEYGRL